VGKNHGDDYVILRIKLELERIRLFFRGENSYLSDLHDMA
jgi:hypothetical protein